MKRAWRFIADHYLFLPAGALIATTWANLASDSYFRVADTLRFFVNDIGMAVVLAYAAQEIIEASHSDGPLFGWRGKLLPFVAGIGAIGGGAGAYLTYIAAAHEPLLRQGWPVACGVDLFAAVAVARYIFRGGAALSFLVLLAIVSDVAGLVMISRAPFSEGAHPAAVLLVIAAVAVSIALRRRGARTMWPSLLIAGPLSWFGCYWGGLHPALALLPIVPALPHSPRAVEDLGRDEEGHPGANHFETVFAHPVQAVAFLFGLVNAGVLLHGYDTGTWAVLVAAFVGRPIGILVAVGIALASGVPRTPDIRWKELIVIAVGASAGFAFALFLSSATYPDGPLLIETDIGALASALGILFAIGTARLLRTGRFRSRSTPSGSGVTRLVIDLARPYRLFLFIILIAMLVETLMALAAPWPLKVIIDDAIGRSDWQRPAASATVAMVAIAVVAGVASYVDNYVTESVGQRVANDLRLRVYDHLEYLSFSYYDAHRTGALLSTITEDVDTIQAFVSESTLSILIDAMTITGMAGLMFWLNWRFTLVVVAVTPFLLVFVTRFKGAVKQATRELRHRESDVVSVIQTGLDSVRTVQAFGAQNVELNRLGAATKTSLAAALNARRIKSLLSPTMSVVVALCTAFVLWRGTALIVAGAMTIGSLMVFLSYLSKFFKPVQDLAKMTNTVAQANVGLERIKSILDVEVNVNEKPDAREPKRFTGAIEFDHVAFSYSPDVPVLRDVTLSITPGTFVGIVGTTGSGKSTIASLIPRFYDPLAGRVLIDGTDIRDLTLAGVRRHISLVLQETVLFAGTVRDNIAYGRHGASKEEIQVAARLANADEFVRRMPGGYDAVVGERGVTLSGGQRQRIGIARALIRNAPILVLDEPTASLDSDSEQQVMQGLERLMKGRTVLMITHRLETLRHATMIVLLHEGRIAEQGTHDELVNAGGRYATLFSLRDDTGVQYAWRAH